MKHTVVVLNDGETFSDISGCRIVEVEVPEGEELDKHVQVMYQFGVDISPVWEKVKKLCGI